MPSVRASRTEQIEIVLVLGAISRSWACSPRRSPSRATRRFRDRRAPARGRRRALPGLLGRQAARHLPLLPGGGTLFGYSEVALHLFELAYQLVFAVVLILTLRGTFRRGGSARSSRC